MHYTIPQLQALDKQYPTERKLLLVPSINFGRELLGALARRSGSWIGWEVATLGTIAQKLSVVALAQRKLRRASDVAISDAINAAFDEAIDAGEVTQNLAALFWSPGTRAAVADALLELRMASVLPAQLLAVSRANEGGSGAARSLAAVMVRYERLLGERGLADSSDSFSAASDAFSVQAPFVLDHALLVATPGWTVRGAPRRLFEQLVERGLRVLQPLPKTHLVRPDGLVDMLAPTVEESGEVEPLSSSVGMFYAGTAAEEIREVIRLAVAGGYGLDEIEIASTDRDEYGAITESLCSHLGANLTSLDGLPLSSTRIGRALEHWFNWLESDYAADHVRRALESGDWSGLEPNGIGAVELAAELRRARIGWGIDATRRAIVRLRGARSRNAVAALPDELESDAHDRQARRYATMESLAGLLEFLVAQAPLARAPGNAESTLSVGELAARTDNVLSLVQSHGPAERATLQRLSERLSQIKAVAGKAVPMTHALAALRQELADLRAWTSSSNTGRPRRATGGHIHLTNIESAGATGRPLLFLVGLDADRTAGPVMQSPLLPELLRNRLNERGAQLATIEQRRRERAWQLGIAIRCTQAKLTVSFALQHGNEGRESAPAPALLHARREQDGDPSLSYEQLLRKLGEPASAVPSSSNVAIDTRDVLLAHMAEGPLVLDGEHLAREIFPGLDRGLRAAAERDGVEAGHYHGVVPAAGLLDPRRTQLPISPSSLEMLASCSLRWFYNTALDARVPEEPVFDPMVWLNVLERGTALHLIYERIVKQTVYEIDDAAERRRRTAAIVSAVAEDMSLRIPPAGPVVKAREVAALEREAQLFVNSERTSWKANPWTTVALEFEFGRDQSAVFPLDDNTSLRVHGRVDRVDRLADGTLRLVDYKTGRSFELDTRRGAFDGGRKLQLAVYSPAVSRHFDAAVSVAEYHFPTQRGEGAIASAGVELLEAAPRIVRSMLDDVAAGRFVATIDKDDCVFCQYAAICRTSTDNYHNTSSPRANWAKEHSSSSPHFVGIVARTRRLGDSE